MTALLCVLLAALLPVETSPATRAVPATAAPPTGAAAAAAAAGPADPAGFPTPRCDLVPGWAPRDEPRRHDAETLFEYKNGAAEGYFTFGFVRMEGVSCARADGLEIVLDVFEVETPELAWGLFAANRDPQAPADTTGAARQILPSNGTLAKGRHFVEVAASPDGNHREVLRAFLDALEGRLPGTAEPPAALGFFPPEGMQPGSLRLVPESVLGLRALGRGWIAQYGVGRAFVVSEASPSAAEATLARLRAQFTAAAGGVAPVDRLGDEAMGARDRYLGGLVLFRKGAHVAGVANVTDGGDALPLAKALAGRLPD